jgi:trypsin
VTSKVILAAFLAPAVMAAVLNPLTGFDQPTRIIGGEDAELGDFPYVVSLQDNGRHFCTGSLIDAKTVLTAAHCVEGIDPSTDTVRAGSLVSILLPHLRTQYRRTGLIQSQSKSKGGRVVGVASAIGHPAFDDTEISNDVGIVKLSTPLSVDDGISFATLAHEHSDPKGKLPATVAGW